MSNGDLFPSPTNALPVDSGGQDRERANPIVSEIDPGPVGRGRIWIVGSTGALSYRDPTNSSWISAGGIGVVPGYSATAAAETIGATGTGGSASTVSRGDHRHAMPAGSAPTAEAIGSTQATGTATTFALGDHRHAMPAAGAPAAEALGSTVVTGAVGTFADSGHVHAMPAKSVATPLVASGSGAAGTSANPSLDDHVHPAQATGGGTPTILLDHALAADISNQAIGATTPFDVIANQNFTKVAAGSLIEIIVRGFGFFADATNGNQYWSQIVIDSGGTPITVLWGAGQNPGVSASRANPFGGGSSIYITGLSAATHTIKVQVEPVFADHFYCRAATGTPPEFCNVQVIEHL